MRSKQNINVRKLVCKVKNNLTDVLLSYVEEINNEETRNNIQKQLYQYLSVLEDRNCVKDKSVSVRILTWEDLYSDEKEKKLAKIAYKLNLPSEINKDDELEILTEFFPYKYKEECIYIPYARERFEEDVNAIRNKEYEWLEYMSYEEIEEYIKINMKFEYEGIEDDFLTKKYWEIKYIPHNSIITEVSFVPKTVTEMINLSFTIQ